MPNKKSFFDSDNRQLTDVFKEKTYFITQKNC